VLAKLKKLTTSRIFLVSAAILLQFVLILLFTIWFSNYFVMYSTAAFLLAVVFAIRIVNTSENMAYKLAWSIFIFAFPAFGVAIYMLLGGNRMTKRALDKMKSMADMMEKNLGEGESTFWMLEGESRTAAKQARYLLNAAFCPPYSDCETRYFPSGEAFFPTLLEELEKAERYIFLEYFIVGQGEMWDKIHEVLLRKVREGVDVRLIYDDIGSIFATDSHFAESLEKEGIRCRVFHRFVPILNGRQNNRDHRKICVIDGVTAFTGGVNISDEYINKKSRFGYWKDNAILLRGEGAWSFTVLFLAMWEYLDNVPESVRGNYEFYRPKTERFDSVTGKGYVIPYHDDPLDEEPVGENVYLNIISSAKDYVWITTPYLIIDEQMEEALCRAAKSGVDVRIVTPGIPDKKLVKKTTESYYPNLIKNGVRIFEYEPGFIHAKTFLCDDRYATVGSVNLDYRSLFLHFECGVWMYRTACLDDIKNDFIGIFRDSRSVESWKHGFFHSVVAGVLELIAPLL